MQVVITKVLTLFGIFTLNVLFGLLPLKVVSLGGHSEARQRFVKRTISYLSCYAGGVFLSTCLLDLLPTVRDNLSLVFDQLQVYTSFPITEFIMAMGLFIIVIVEQTVLTCKERTAEAEEGKSHDEEAVTKPLLEGHFGQQSHGSINHEQAVSGHPEADDHYIANSESRRNFLSHGHGHEHSHSHIDVNAHSSFRSYVLLMALSIHSIFEGLAVGLQSSNELVLEIFSALVIHKCLLAFSLGMNFVQSKLGSCAVLLAVMCFAIMAPIGIAIGIGIMETASDFTSSMVNGVLQGLATGTFLYVTFFEVLPHEMNSPGNRLLKLLCIILGFSTICGLLFLHSNVLRPTCYRSAEPV
ncbi:zinc transporter ZIP1-like [Ptychodera flava]|uniref:zinc transporter ZIP1-like n=1 Tax=Ptychodera flava TaxID=63121 RepID=UPI00396A29BE